MLDEPHQEELPFDHYIDGLGQVLPAAAVAEIRQRAEADAESVLPSGSGALADGLLIEIPEADERRVQVLAAHTNPGLSRRDFLGPYLASLAGAIAGAGASGAISMAVYRMEKVDQEYRVNPAIILDIAQVFDRADQLRALREDLKSSFRTEYRLIDAILTHGMGFERVLANMAWLESLARDGALDPDVRAFLVRKYASDHRYLGLTAQARRIFDAIRISDIRHPVIRCMSIEMRYATLLPRLIEQPEKLFDGALDYGEALRRDCHPILGDIADLTQSDFEGLVHAHQSSEVLEPIGQYFKWQLIRADDEERAGEALEKTILLTQALVNCRKADERLVPSVSRKPWWHIARLAPYAYARGFLRIAGRIVDICEGKEPGHNIFQPARMMDFHFEESQSLRSPVYIEYLLVRALLDRERSGSWGLFESKFLSRGKARRIIHAALQKAVASIATLAGVEGLDSRKFASLVRVEPGDIMMKCVLRAHRAL